MKFLFFGTVCVISVLLAASSFAQSLDDCKKIASATDRLDCFDKLPASGASKEPSALTKSVPKPPAASGEDKFITEAKNRIKRLLREPDSAKFTGVKIKTTGEGVKVVCGQVNAKNGFGGFTGPKDFYYDGKINRIVISDGGAGNPTPFGAAMLDLIYIESSKTYDHYCK